MQPLSSSCRSSSRYTTKSSVPFAGLVAAALLLSFASPTSSCTEQERGSLLGFLGGLAPGGSGGLNVSWVNGTDCCQWDGVLCSGDGTVTDVLVASRGLRGIVSPSLGDLAGLLHLNLSHNSLEGGLPTELVFSRSIIVLDVSFNRLDGHLQELQSSDTGLPLKVLNISSNLFTGQFPSTTWEAMKNLVALNASNNTFTGQIPSSICTNAPLFDMLDLCFNQFSGNIPPGLGSCSMLKVLKVGHNNLSGVLPPELFNATSLEQLSLPNNFLQGVIDGSHIAKLSNLTVLNLGSTGLSGKIPDSVGQLTRLEQLYLDNNKMSGELPPALGNCSNLRYIISTPIKNRLGGDGMPAIYEFQPFDLYLTHLRQPVAVLQKDARKSPYFSREPLRHSVPDPSRPNPRYLPRASNRTPIWRGRRRPLQWSDASSLPMQSTTTSTPPPHFPSPPPTISASMVPTPSVPQRLSCLLLRYSSPPPIITAPTPSSSPSPLPPPPCPLTPTTASTPPATRCSSRRRCRHNTTHSSAYDALHDCPLQVKRCSQGPPDRLHEARDSDHRHRRRRPLISSLGCLFHALCSSHLLSLICQIAVLVLSGSHIAAFSTQTAGGAKRQARDQASE